MNEEEKNGLEKDFYRMMISGRGLNEFCDYLSDKVGNPVSIHLPTRTIIARSRSYTRDLVDEFVNTFSLSPPQTVKEIFSSIGQRLQKEGVFIDAFPYYRYRQVLGGCYYRNHLIAILQCPITGTADADYIDEVFHLAIPPAVALLRINNYITDNSAHHMQIYLSSLLHGNSGEIFQQLSRSGSAISGTEYWRLTVIVPDEHTDPRELQRRVDQYCSVREKLWCVEYEENIVVLIDSGLEKKLSGLEQLCKDSASLSVSEPYAELKRTRDVYQQCGLALKLARFEDRDEKVILLNEYKAPIYFLRLYTNASALGWRENELEEIKKYDVLHGSEYFETVRAYLLNNMDYGTMADRLHVHRNTIAYRMQRISELFDLNLKDCRTITRLYLALFTSLLPVQSNI